MTGLIRKLYNANKSSFLTTIVVFLAALLASIYQIINSHKWELAFFTFVAIILFTIVIVLAMQIALEFRNETLNRFMGFFETKDIQTHSWFHSTNRLKAIESELDRQTEITVVSRYMNYEQDDTDSFIEVIRDNISTKQIKYRYVIKNSGESKHICDTLVNEFKDKIEVIEISEDDFDYPSDIVIYKPKKDLKKPTSLYMEIPSHKDWKQRGWVKIESREMGVIIKGIEKTIHKKLNTR